jgi:SAM-dependent methyltransferase
MNREAGRRQQEAAYGRPYHHLIHETGRGIPYISLLRIVRDALAPAPGDRILDAGCGDGRLLSELSGGGATLCGIDTSLAALRFAAGFNPGALLCVQDVTALALADASFTKAALVETLEHLQRVEAAAAVSEVARVLRPGGMLVVSVPTTRLPQPAKHYPHFTAPELRSLLEKWFTIMTLSGHDRDSRPYRLLVSLVDNGLWHLRGGVNRILRLYFKRCIETVPPDKARRLIAVCVKS